MQKPQIVTDLHSPAERHAPEVIHLTIRALHPAFRQQEEALGSFGPFDHLLAGVPPGPSSPHPGDEFPRLRLVNPDHTQAGKAVSQDVQQDHGDVAVLYTGGGDDHREEPPEGIDKDVTLAPLDLFVCIKAADPPCSVVLTDWLSMMPALGCRGLPAATRTSPRRRSCISCQGPSCCQIQK